jgi:hypothetical protein
MYRTLEPIEYKTYDANDIRIFDRNIIVRGTVSYSNMRLIKSPHYKYVGGDFYCNNNKLTSLEGCPIYVGGSFHCSHNQLTSLKYCPIHVGGSFYCNHNQLTSLEGCPTYIGCDCYCRSDKVKLSLPEGVNIGGKFHNW